MCQKSNVLYNWECTVKYICPDSGYDGQSSKNNFTCSSQHTSLYESWKRHEDGTGETSQSHSFLYDHQIEDHNGVPPKFKLQSKIQIQNSVFGDTQKKVGHGHILARS